MHLSIIVPVYNEEETIPLLYQAVMEAMEPISQT